MDENGQVAKDSTDQCASTWEGRSALSEPETSAVVKYLADSQTKRRVRAFLDVHSFTQKVLPPGCNGYPVDAASKKTGIDTAAAVAKSMNEAHSNAEHDYASGDCEQLMYRCSGVAHDWAHGTAKARLASHPMPIQHTDSTPIRHPIDLLR